MRKEKDSTQCYGHDTSFSDGTEMPRTGCKRLHSLFFGNNSSDCALPKAPAALQAGGWDWQPLRAILASTAVYTYHYHTQTDSIYLLIAWNANLHHGKAVRPLRGRGSVP